jgi:lactate permease
VAAVSGIGGGLASVISPAKLQNAAAVIDRIGLESQVIRATVVIALLMVLAAALMTFVFLAS